jgi:hypothetical protein
VENWGIYCAADRSTELVKYSTVESTVGKSRSSNVKDWEKEAQSETSDDPLRRTWHSWRWCHVRVYRVVGKNCLVKVDCYTWTTEGKLQGRRGSWSQAKMDMCTCVRED